MKGGNVEKDEFWKAWASLEKHFNSELTNYNRRKLYLSLKSKNINDFVLACEFIKNNFERIPTEDEIVAIIKSKKISDAENTLIDFGKYKIRRGTSARDSFFIIKGFDPNKEGT